MFKTEKTEIASIHRILQRELEEVVEVAVQRLERCPVIKMAYDETCTAAIGDERRAFEALEELVKKEVLSIAQLDLYGIGVRRAKVNVSAGLLFGSTRGITIVIEAKASLSRFGKLNKVAAVGATFKVTK